MVTKKPEAFAAHPAYLLASIQLLRKEPIINQTLLKCIKIPLYFAARGVIYSNY